MYTEGKSADKRTKVGKFAGAQGVSKMPKEYTSEKPIQCIISPTSFKKRIPKQDASVSYESHKSIYDEILSVLKEYTDQIAIMKKEPRKFVDSSEVLEKLSRAVYAWFDSVGIETIDHTGKTERDKIFRIMYDMLDDIGWGYAARASINFWPKGMPYTLDQYKTPMESGSFPTSLWKVIDQDDYFLGKCIYEDASMRCKEVSNFRIYMKAAFMRLMAGPSGRKLLDAVTEEKLPATMFYPTKEGCQPVDHFMSDLQSSTPATDDLEIKMKPMPISKVPIDIGMKDSAFLRKAIDWQRHLDVDVSVVARPREMTTEMADLKVDDIPKRKKMDDWLDIDSEPRFRETEGHYVLSPMFINVAEALLLHLYRHKPWKMAKFNDPRIYEQDTELSGWKDPKYMAVGLWLNEIRREHGLPEYKYTWIQKRKR
ncbi:hypothetical protein [Aureibacter tunicatorum]|uniref:Uncharacterized protein n=1 Tax=Aureibacter tunicatorum TaxID=866807 RepID=A0AAE3XHK4_9BACT|nr:hypothetical protein [Aureibacter tunicatorum]MDR6237831.1 hypothetical protein [Aureibacter tunicatorum]BDD02867.1 hypothetical protein AUTU_03500 [Aureibacter tunicatorum]